MQIKNKRQQVPLRLAERRKKQIILRLELLSALFVVILGALSYFSYSPTFAISNIEVLGLVDSDKVAVEEYVKTNLEGGHLLLFSKRNFLLYQKNSIEQGIYAEFKKVEKVKLATKDIHNLIVTVAPREPYALWCAGSITQSSVGTSTSNQTTGCYHVDWGGLVFEKESDAPASGKVALYKTFGKENMIGERILDQGKFAKLRELLRSLTELNLKPEGVVFKDNGDFEVRTGTDGKFIFGGSDDLNVSVNNLKLLLDSEEFKKEVVVGSKKIDYVDLRFGKKLFFKVK